MYQTTKGEFMKAGIYLGKEKVKIQELPLPEVGDYDVLIQNMWNRCGCFYAWSKYRT